MRASSKAAQAHAKTVLERRRNAVVLILRFLADLNYTAAYQALRKESNLSLEHVDCADNVDLLSLIQVGLLSKSNWVACQADLRCSPCCQTDYEDVDNQYVTTSELWASTTPVPWDAIVSES